MCSENGKYPFYELPRIKNLVDMMCQKALQKPEEIAFAWYENDVLATVTYKTFYNHVQSVATHIRECGFLKCNIGIWGKNSYNWLLTFMAVLLSGNVAVPFDKDMSLEEFKEVYYRMNICFVFADENLKEKNQLLGEEIQISSYYVSELCHKESSNKFPELIIPDIDPNSMACIFLTSGTTGKRKGVMLSHSNIAEDINNSCQMFELTGNTLAVLPFHHAFGLMVAVWMVFNYGHIVYISQGLRMLQKELVKSKPQTMMLVPLFVETFYKQLKLKCNANIEAARSFFGGKLEFIICGGAALDKLFIKEFRSFGIEILNGYGTTECSPVAAVNRNLHHKDGTVGFCIPETKAFIANDGEVLISGKHVMLGYYNEPKETKAVLHDGWYYTGDIGSIDEDGFITLTGRKKNLIVLSSGENISPEELEEQLLHIKNVDEVIVSSDGRSLIAEIYSQIKDQNIRCCIQSTIDEMNRSQPRYKHISQIIFRDQPFEKTTSQKIIRR